MTPNTRVRFAPSPTGFLHVGGARTLLFNYLYARKTSGTLVLRVEDTDQERSTPEFEKMLLEDVDNIGMIADESPQKSGPHHPYRQSERLAIYGKYAKQLLEEDKAYYCFCSDDEITRKRELAMKMGRPPHYDGTCAKIPLAESRARLAKGEKAGLRFRAFNKDYTLKDHVKGDVTFPSGVVGDFFITRTPRPHEKEIAEGIGMPVYNFCCVIDDYEMKMSHVIRGDDHLSNTARQLMIYDGLGWKLPEFAHISMILGADKQKLSKRNGDSSVHEYLEQGYFVDALMNFLVLLGWSPKGEYKTKSGHPEIFSMEEMISMFTLDGLQKSPAVFDVQKLRWMNAQYMRAKPLDEVYKLAKPFLKDSRYLSKGEEALRLMIDIIRGECTLLSDLPKALDSHFLGQPALEEEAKKIYTDAANLAVIDCTREEMKAAPESITSEWVDGLQKTIATKTGAKGKGLFMTFRVVMTGKVHGPELKKVLPILGKTEILKRMDQIKNQL